MKCFSHPEVDAVAVCKRCQKGVCRECAIDIGHAVVCSPQHEVESLEIESLVNRNIQATKIQPQSVTAANLSWVLMGIIFTGFGYTNHNQFLLIFGIFCIAYWLYLKAYNGRVFKKLDGDKT